MSEKISLDSSELHKQFTRTYPAHILPEPFQKPQI